jgi:VCBS repeat-containing protein
MFGDNGPVLTLDQAGYIGSFTLGAVTQSNGVASVAFEFSLGNDQILVPGETLTQSYSVSVADVQNPAAAATQTVTVSIGGVGNDDFVFHPGIGTATVVNFNSQVDTIELDGFANAHTVDQLQSLISTNAHGDAVIDLGHSDSITLSGTTLAQLQHVLTTAVLLH